MEQAIDVPAAICAPEKKGPGTIRLDTRLSTAQELGRRLYFRVGDDLVTFPAAYSAAAPDPERADCLAVTRELSFVFWASDLAAPGPDMPRPVSFLAGPPAGSDRPADDFLVDVTRLYYGAHANWLGISTRIQQVRRNDARRGMLYGLEHFVSGASQILIRLSEDRTVLVEFANIVAGMGFQSEGWSSRALISARFVDRWEIVYTGIDSFLVRNTVKGYFKRLRR